MCFCRILLDPGSNDVGNFKQSAQGCALEHTVSDLLWPKKKSCISQKTRGFTSLHLVFVTFVRLNMKIYDMKIHDKFHAVPDIEQGQNTKSWYGLSTIN